jgi:hypothetical protein
MPSYRGVTTGYTPTLPGRPTGRLTHVDLWAVAGDQGCSSGWIHASRTTTKHDRASIRPPLASTPPGTAAAWAASAVAHPSARAPKDAGRSGVVRRRKTSSVAPATQGSVRLEATTSTGAVGLAEPTSRYRPAPMARSIWSGTIVRAHRHFSAPGSLTSGPGRASAYGASPTLSTALGRVVSGGCSRTRRRASATGACQRPRPRRTSAGPRLVRRCEGR